VVSWFRRGSGIESSQSHSMRQLVFMVNKRIKIKKNDLKPSYYSLVNWIWGHKINLDTIRLRNRSWDRVWITVARQIHIPILHIICENINNKK